MKAETNRHKQAAETKLTITRAALALFKDKGYEDVSVMDICRSAGLSIGAFYHHFKTKDDIINFGHAQVDLMLEDKLSENVSREWRDEILYIMREAGLLLQELGWHFVARAYRHMLDSPVKLSLSRERAVFIRLKAEIEKGKAAGSIAPDRLADDFAEDIMRWVRGAIFDWCLREGAYCLADRLEGELSLFFDALEQRRENKARGAS